MDKVIVKRGIDRPPDDHVNDAIKNLGKGWGVVSAVTTVEIYGPDYKVLYVITVVVHKDD
jgi:hypothetical protein